MATRSPSKAARAASADMFAATPSELGERRRERLIRWVYTRRWYHFKGIAEELNLPEEDASYILWRYRRGVELGAQCPVCYSFKGHAAIYHWLPWCKLCSGIRKASYEARRWAYLRERSVMLRGLKEVYGED